MYFRPLAVLAAISALTLPAAAQDTTVYAGGALEFALDRDGDGDNSLEAEAYVEGEYRGFYAGVWALAARHSDLNEVDVYLGYRGESAQGIGYDLSYTRYFYPDDGGNCCGELGLVLGAPLGQLGNGYVEVNYDPGNSIGSAYVGLDYAATDRISLGMRYGVYEVEFASAEREWDLGGTYALTDQLGADLRWYDSSDAPGYLALKVSFDTTLFSR